MLIECGEAARREVKTKYEQLVREVRAVYAEADAAVEEFCRISGLRCVPGCGACCETGVVEATALQMLPAAFHLWRTGVAWGVMRALQEGSTTNRCILYRPDESRQGYGRCGLYQYRALVCRLFGFAGRRSKRGEVEIVACRLLRAQLPPERAHAASWQDSVPLLPQFQMRLWGIAPRLSHPAGVNEALGEALDHIGLRLGLVGADGEDLTHAGRASPADTGRGGGDVAGSFGPRDTAGEG